MKRVVKSGTGWRIGWNPEAQDYPGLVAGENWAIELTEAELQDFRRLSAELCQTIIKIATELMPEERITCEAESELLWMEIEGYPHAYSLRFILNTGRRCEGNWPENVVQELLPATRMLQVF